MMRSSRLERLALWSAAVLLLGCAHFASAQETFDQKRKAAGEQVRLLLERAASGDENARAALSTMYGARTPPPFFFADFQVAVDFYRYGAQLGEGKAMYFLGNMYCSESGDHKKQPDECEKWHRLAAEKGNADAMSSLSASYRYGDKKDLEQSRYWERKAAEAGDGLSMLYLARRYDEGDEVERDPVQAALWYERAEAAGQRTPAVIKREHQVCVADMQKGASDGNADAMYALGRSYASGGFYGCGLEQNYTQAIRWYTEAAQRGHAVAANNLGALFGRGEGTPQDSKRAMYWYEIAAQSGLPRAMFNIAAMLKDGEIGQIDTPGAVAWYRLATEHLSKNPRDWHLEELALRSHLKLIMEPCILRRKLSTAQLAKSDEMLKGLSEKIKSPLPPSERLSNSPEYLEACDRAGAEPGR